MPLHVYMAAGMRAESLHLSTGLGNQGESIKIFTAPTLSFIFWFLSSSDFSEALHPVIKAELTEGF